MAKMDLISLILAEGNPYYTTQSRAPEVLVSVVAGVDADAVMGKVDVVAEVASVPDGAYFGSYSEF